MESISNQSDVTNIRGFEELWLHSVHSFGKIVQSFLRIAAVLTVHTEERSGNLPQPAGYGWLAYPKSLCDRILRRVSTLVEDEHGKFLGHS